MFPVAFEAKFVVKEIEGLRQGNKPGPDPSVAILYPTKVQSRELEAACIAVNLPYKIIGRTNFYERAEIADCLCFLHVLARDGGQVEETAMLRAFKTPTKGIGKKTVTEFDSYWKQVKSFCLREKKPPLSRLDVLISLTDFQRHDVFLSSNAPAPFGVISNRAMKHLQNFSRQMRQIRELAYSRNLEQLLRDIVDILDLRSHVAKSYPDKEFDKRWSNIQLLLKKSQQYSRVTPCLRPRQAAGADEVDNDSAPIDKFLDDITPESESDMDDDCDGDVKRFVVNLMTIHASKGKEFDAVFIVGNEDGTLPLYMSCWSAEELDEERRLCYVAMTRAKTYLYMTWREKVMVTLKDGNKEEKSPSPSRFLADILNGPDPADVEPEMCFEEFKDDNEQSHDAESLGSGQVNDSNDVEPNVIAEPRE